MTIFRPQQLAVSRLAVLALSLHAALPAHATDAEPVPQAKVEVHGSVDQYDARREDTSTRIVVTQEELKKYGDSTVADVLRRQPGISVSGGGPGRGGEIRMRGLGNGYTQILLNGEPAPNGFSVDSLAPELVEKIEILRVATADLSAQSIAGTINIILKRKARKGQRDLKMQAEHSNVFFSPSASLQIGDKRKDMSYSLAMDVRKGSFEQAYDQVEEGWDSAGRPVLQRRAVRQNNGGFRALSLTPRVNWTLSNGDTLSSQSFVRVQRSDSRTEGHWSATLGDLPDYPNDRTWPDDHRSQLRTDLNWMHKLGQDEKLEAKVGLNANRVRNRQHEAGYDEAERRTLDRDVHNDTDGRGVTLTGKYSVSWTTGHEFSAGWDAARQSTDVGRDSLELQGLAGTPVRDDRQYNATLHRLALYAQDEYAVTPRLSTYLGLRWETLRTRSAGSDFSAIRNDANMLSPILQSLWKLNDSKQDQLRIALSRTYRGVDLERLMPRVTRSLNNTEVTPDVSGNPALKPEQASGIDVALEHYGRHGEQASLSVYARRIGDIIHDDTRLAQGRWTTVPVNDGSARTRGVEFDAKFPLRALYARGGNIDLHMNVTRNWSSVSNVPGPDNRLAGQTPLTANVGFDDHFGATLSGGANFTFRSGGPQRISQTTSTYSTVKRELDLYALWKLTPKMQLRVTAVNLLAEPATEVTRYDDAFGGLRSTSVYPFSAILRVGLEVQL
ncbi:TonB-dependent receptor plug domain-containing protein [Massilia rhizosphaerae]|uniref:TonB-dependent receptor plug domain-containing protein n=1 Tax=Massilia rhizosphaerae TaxID=2784389 RepID=UPI0018DD1805|nr:TonB-dependent receptor [Massilia rhizosphaerae]